jgi:hypothetical protein
MIKMYKLRKPEEIFFKRIISRLGSNYAIAREDLYQGSRFKFYKGLNSSNKFLC